MIRRLKIKFIVLALSALFILLSVIVAGMNLLNYREVVGEADMILSLLSQNQGTFPDPEEEIDEWLPPDMSPEIPFETRFFSVLVDEAGETAHIDTGSIRAIDSGTADRYAREVLEGSRDRGFVGAYRYQKMEEPEGMRITFLDCGRKLDLFQNFVIFSVSMSLLGYLITAVVICFFAGRFIRPVAESYNKQRRFITDVSHEIKTPLTIISANADVLKMDMGENECLEDIQQQTKRLTGLTNDLVYLARMDESEDGVQMIEFPVSDVVQEAAAPFKALSQAQNKELNLSIQPMLSMRGNNPAIFQLVSILLDNALKYSPGESRIDLKFEKQNRKLVLSVKNTSLLPITSENLRHVFDRFYRTDPSRNSETGGHGIGLSLAQAIVNAHSGKITASSPDGKTFLVTAAFPA